jgi:hypothetical protein
MTMSKPSIPTIAELSPALADLQAKRYQLGTEAAALRAEQFDIARTDPQPETVDAQAVRVAAILGHTSPAKLAGGLERLRQIATRLRDIDAALAVLDAQIQAERSRASAKVQVMLEPEFRDRRKAVCEALIGVHAADFRLRSLVEDVEAQGLSSGNMNQAFPHRLDSPKDAHGWVGQYLEQARREGIISRTAIPTELVA